MKRGCLIVFGLAAAVSHLLGADGTSVSLDSGSKFIYNENTAATIKLTGGTSLDGDGAVLQLGYYSAATTADNFSGSWVALSGEASLNTAIIQGSSPPEPYTKTSIGDRNSQGGADGAFFLGTLTFFPANPLSNHDLPTPGTPLAVRFYNGTTIATSTYYNTVSDDAWLWKIPATPTAPVAISLDDIDLEWLSVSLGQNANTEFHTTISTVAVPEPATFICPVLGALALGLHAYRRRRRAAQAVLL